MSALCCSMICGELAVPTVLLDTVAVLSVLSYVCPSRDFCQAICNKSLINCVGA